MYHRWTKTNKSRRETAFGPKKEREREREKRGCWSGDFEARVMAFLVLSCDRTLTLLAHIRAWSWLLSAFLHGAQLPARSRACSRTRVVLLMGALISVFVFTREKPPLPITLPAVRFGFHDPLVLDGRTSSIQLERTCFYIPACRTQRRRISDMFRRGGRR